MQVERKICFPKGRKLKILQISDAQDMHFVRYALPQMINRACDAVQPDLIVLTGDNIHGNHLDEDYIGRKTDDLSVILLHMQQALYHVLRPIERRGVPFCMIFGNHDDLNPVSKQEQADLYKDYTCFFGLNDTEPQLDCDTYNVPIYSSEGDAVVFNLWMLDSAGKDDGTGNGFEYVKPEAIEWYKRESDHLKAANGGKPVPSLMFQHVPVPQIRELFIPCGEDDPNVVKWRGPDKQPCKLDQERADGYADEYPDVCDEDFGQLDAIREQGDVCALVFGHDHANNFTCDLDSVHIVQTPGASFRSYGTERARGVRVFEIGEDDPWNVETYTLSYYDLVGKTPANRVAFFMSADEYDRKRVIVLGAAAAAVLTVGAAGVAKRIRRHRKSK